MCHYFLDRWYPTLNDKSNEVHPSISRHFVIRHLVIHHLVIRHLVIHHLVILVQFSCTCIASLFIYILKHNIHGAHVLSYYTLSLPKKSFTLVLYSSSCPCLVIFSSISREALKKKFKYFILDILIC